MYKAKNTETGESLLISKEDLYEGVGFSDIEKVAFESEMDEFGYFEVPFYKITKA